MDEILRLRQERARLINEARAIIEKAEGEKRDLNAEEQGQYDKMWGDIEGLGKRADRLERQLTAEAELRQSAGRATQDDPAGDQGEQGKEKRGRAAPAYENAFRSYLRGGRPAAGVLEERALQADVDTLGGYLVPDVFISEFLQGLDAAVFIRQWATKHQIPNADSLGVPTLDADMSDPVWTSELGTGDEDQAMRFGKRELRPHPLAKRIKVSKTLLRKAPQVEGIVRERMTYRFARVMENAYLNGDGANKPLGIFVANAAGIPAARDYATDNTSTAITFDGLIGAKFHLKPQYWPRAKWLLHPTAMAALLKVKSVTDGQYVWRESVRVGEPDTLLGLPVFLSELVPATFTTGLYVGVLGDFSKYWIADALDMEIQRLDELYAETNQVGFIGRMESDGMPVLPEAFVRIKLG